MLNPRLSIKGTLAVCVGLCFGSMPLVPANAVACGGGFEGLTPSPSELNFGKVKIGEAPKKTITYTASGEVSIAGKAEVLDGAGGEMSISEDTCEKSVLKAGKTCKVVVAFTPTVKLLDTGQQFLKYEIVATHSLGEAEVALIGEGI